MDADDFTGTVEPQGPSKRSYDWQVSACWLLVILPQVLACFAVMTLAHIDVHRWLIVTSGPSTFLAQALVDAHYRRRGLSRGGKTIEVWARAGDFPDAKVEPVALPCLPSDTWCIGGLFLMGIGFSCGFYWSIVWVGTGHVPPDGFGGLGAPAAFMLGLYGARMVILGGLTRPTTRIDDAGVSGLPTGLALWTRSVPWSAIATCAIETRRDTFGAINRIRPTFHDAAGHPLLALNLVHNPIPDQERIAQAIRAHLPKLPRGDAWD